MSEKADEFRGKDLVVRFEAARCIHSRQCVLDQPEVFRANTTGPWIFPDRGTLDQIVRVAHACPSGAITYERLDGGAQEAAPAVNVMRVRENGPLALHADAVIAGTKAFRASLCRCGASNNKPWCDGSHVQAGFVATGEPPTQASVTLAQRDGAVTVNPIANGPLEVTGNLEICSGTGRTLNRMQKAFLCRCGASNNKPFCDGSHKKTGFTAQGVAKGRQ